MKIQEVPVCELSMIMRFRSSERWHCVNW